MGCISQINCPDSGIYSISSECLKGILYFHDDAFQLCLANPCAELITEDCTLVLRVVRRSCVCYLLVFCLSIVCRSCVLRSYHHVRSNAAEVARRSNAGVVSGDEDEKPTTTK